MKPTTIFVRGGYAIEDVDASYSRALAEALAPLFSRFSPRPNNVADALASARLLFSEIGFTQSQRARLIGGYRGARVNREAETAALAVAGPLSDFGETSVRALASDGVDLERAQNAHARRQGRYEVAVGFTPEALSLNVGWLQARRKITIFVTDEHAGGRGYDVFSYGARQDFFHSNVPDLAQSLIIATHAIASLSREGSVTYHLTSRGKRMVGP